MKRNPELYVLSSILGLCARCCTVALIVSLLAGAAEAQFWAKKKKPEDKPASNPHQ